MPFKKSTEDINQTKLNQQIVINTNKHWKMYKNSELNNPYGVDMPLNK